MLIGMEQTLVCTGCGWAGLLSWFKRRTYWWCWKRHIYHPRHRCFQSGHWSRLRLLHFGQAVFLLHCVIY